MALPATRKSGNKTRKSTPNKSAKSRIASVFKRKAAGAKNADDKASFAGDHSEITSIVSSMEREAKKLHTLMKDQKYKDAAIKHATNKGTVNKKEFAKQGQMIRALLESTLPEMVGSYSSYVKDYLDAAEKSKVAQEERLQKERAKQAKADAKQAKKEAKKEAKEIKKQQKATAKAASAAQKDSAADAAAATKTEDVASDKATTTKKKGGIRGRVGTLKRKASTAKSSVVSAVKKRVNKGKNAAAKELPDANAAKEATPADTPATKKKSSIRGKVGALKSKAGTAIKNRASSLKRKVSSRRKPAVADSATTQKVSDDAKTENVAASQTVTPQALSASESAATESSKSKTVAAKAQKSSKINTQEPEQVTDKQIEDDVQPKSKTNSRRIAAARKKFAKQKGISSSSADSRLKKRRAANNRVSHYAMQDNLAASNVLADDSDVISKKATKADSRVVQGDAMSSSAEGLDGLLQNLEMLETRMRRQRLIVEKRRERVRILKKRLYNSSVKVQQISAKMLSLQQAQADSLQKHLSKTEEGHEGDIDDTMASFNSGEHEKYAQSVAKMTEELRQEKAANLLIKQELVKNKRHLRFSEVKLMSSVETRARMLKEAQKMESNTSDLSAKENATQRGSAGATRGLKGVSVADDNVDSRDHAKGKGSFVGRLRASNKSSNKGSGRQH